jgi:predicted ATPase
MTSCYNVARMRRTLPRDETAFFGRAAEISEIDRRRAAGARLVTLVGLGGVGKTRLALAAAERTDGAIETIAFVPLSSARSLEAGVRETARALAFHPTPESSAAEAALATASAIAKRGPVLLVLDGVEALGAAARELVAPLLDGAPELTILATSREPIGARGEERILVGPLADDEAVALLLDRARTAASGDVAIAENDALALVRRVDRLPLAIELAASRLEVLSPAEVLRRMSERLDVLADASGAAPPQHRTMSTTLDWSWDALSPDERSALVQATVFAAPFGVEAAEEVVELAGGDVLAALEGLVKRSLLTRVMVDGQVRLGTYQTVRAWARGKSALAPSASERHARHHLAEAELAAASAYGENGISALDRLAELLPELLAAFDATAATHPDVAARIVLALSDLLLFRGVRELRAELFAAGAKAAASTGDERLLARLLVANARVALEVGRVTDAERDLARAEALAARTGDEVTRAEALRSLGWALLALGRTDDAETRLEHARSLHEAHGSPRGLADCLVARGILHALSGMPQESLRCLRDALAIHVEQGDAIRQEKVLAFGQMVGHDARELARGLPRDVLARAPAASRDALPSGIAELVRGAGEAARPFYDAVDQYRRGAAADAQGEPERALELFDAAIATLGRAGVVRGVAAIHAHAAATLAAAGDPREADARLSHAMAAKPTASPLERVVIELFAAASSVVRGDADAKETARAAELLERVRRNEVGSAEAGVAAAVLERALSHVGARGTKKARASLVVGPEARWMIPPRGERIDLVRHGPARKVLDRLVTARVDAPGTALSADALLEAGWPGERMRHSAGLLRVYSVVRRLRRLGLEPILVTRDDGYLLDPEAGVLRESP